MRKRGLCLLWIAALSVAIPVPLAWSANKSFTAAVSTDWFDAGNWQPAGVPGTDDVAIVTGNTAVLTADATVGALTMTGGTITGPGTLTVNGLMTWFFGTISGSGAIDVEGGMDLGGSAKSLAQRTVNLEGGTATMKGPSFITMSAGAVFNNDATFEATNDQGLQNNQGFFGEGSFHNTGTFRKTLGNSGETVFDGVTFDNSGTVEVLSGTLRLAGGGTSSGGFSVAGTLELGGVQVFQAASSVTGDGTVRVLSGTADFLGDYAITGTTRTSNGTANYTGAITAVGSLVIGGGIANFSSGKTIQTDTMIQSGGELTGSDTVEVGDTLFWTGGTMSGSGDTVAQGGMILSGSAKTLRQRALDLDAGTAVMSGLSFIDMTDGAIFNNHATVEASDDQGSFNNQGFFTGPGMFNNFGTFRKTAGNTGETVVSGVVFNNLGSVEVLSGTLRLDAGGIANGSFAISAGGLLRLGGSQVLQASSSVSGAGAVLFLNGTSQIGGTYAVSGETNVSGAEVSFSGAPSQVGALVVAGGQADFSSGQAVTATSLRQSGGTLTGSDTITVTGTVTWTAGAMSGSGTLNAEGSMDLSGSAKTLDQRTVNLNGGMAVMSGPSFIDMSGDAVFKNNGTFETSDDQGLFNNQGFFQGPGAFVNDGTFRKTAGNSGETVFQGVGFTNTGTVEALSGMLRFTDTYVQTAGVTRVDGGTLASVEDVQILGGELDGVGAVAAPVQNGGRVQPGFPLGALAVSNYTQQAGGTLAIELGGTEPGTGYDRLAVSNGAALDGTLQVRLRDGFTPMPGDVFDVVTYTAHTGDFAAVDADLLPGNLSFEVQSGPGSVRLLVVGGGTETPTEAPTALPTAAFTETPTGATPEPSHTATGTPPPTATPTPTPTVTPAGPGDANCDGRITAADETALVLSIVTGTQFPCRLADANQDGEVNADDFPALTGAIFPQVCGGFAGIVCPADAFCELPPGMCAANDLFGTCVEKPVFCVQVFAPVCGCDGVTYNSDCARQDAGVSKSHDGTC